MEMSSKKVACRTEVLKRFLQMIPSSTLVLVKKHFKLIHSFMLEEISAKLFAEEIITQDEIDKIKSHKVHCEKNGKLLEIVRKRPEVFQKFCNCFNISGLAYIEKELLEEFEHIEKLKSAIKRGEDDVKIDDLYLEMVEKETLHFFTAAPFLTPFIDCIDRVKIDLQHSLQNSDIDIELLIISCDAVGQFQCNSEAPRVNLLNFQCTIHVNTTTYEELVMQFAAMKTKLVKVLERDPDALRQLKCYVSHVKKCIATKETDMNNIGSVAELINYLDSSWNFFHCDYIKHAIDATGNVEAIKTVTDYLAVFQPTLSLLTNGAESSATYTDEKKEMVDVKAHVLFDGITPGMYKNIKNAVCCALSLDPSLLIFRGFKSGSVIIMWKMNSEFLKYVQSITFDPTTHLIMRLYGITKIYVNESELYEESETILLHKSCKSGELEDVKLAIGAGVDVDVFDHEGFTSLYIAAKSGQTSVVHYLLQNNANVNLVQQNKNKLTALMAASDYGHCDTVAELLEKGADVNYQDQNCHASAIHFACDKGHTKVVAMLIAHDTNLNLQTNDGGSPLLIASQNGFCEIVSMLCENGAEVNLANNEGQTALHCASHYDHLEVAKLLLAYGADNKFQTKDGKTPLCMAHDPKIRALLQETDQPGVTPLHVASKYGVDKAVAILLDKGAKVNAETQYGICPLHFASLIGHKGIIDMLIERGAAINHQTKNGLSALHGAVQHDHSEVVGKLLECNADVTLKDKNEITALYIATNKGYSKMVSLLLAAGAETDCQDKNGLSPLHLASFRGNSDIVAALLEYHADVNIKDKNGYTPLWLATYKGHSQVVAQLIAAQAELNCQDRINGVTPLYVAAESGNLAVVELLLEGGANSNHQSEDGYSSLHVASQNGHSEVVAKLLQSHADVMLKDKNGVTALHVASYGGHSEVVAQLVIAGADIDCQDKLHGATSLILAAMQGHAEVINTLLQANASIELHDFCNKTAIIHAVMMKHIWIVDILYKANANINHRIKPHGLTAIIIASKIGDTQMQEMLTQCGANQNQEERKSYEEHPSETNEFFQQHKRQLKDTSREMTRANLRFPISV